MLAGPQLTAGDYRRAAERRADAGDYAGAIIERTRAIAVELETRGVLLPRPGRTASELAAEAAVSLPDHAAGLREAARLFDDVRYGDRPGTLAGLSAGPAPGREHPVGPDARRRGGRADGRSRCHGRPAGRG